MLAKHLRASRITFVCIAVLALISANVYAAKVRARVTDTSGQTYDMASLRLESGNRLEIVCGGARMAMPFKRVSVMKIDPGVITSIDGRPFFGVEIRTRGGDVIGSLPGDGRCFVSAGGLRGKTVQKTRYSAPFGSLMNVQFFGKGEDAGARQGDNDEEDEEDEE